MSIYALKPKFQNLLRPLVQRLYQKGVTANQVTVFACAVSIALGLLLSCLANLPALFWLMPVWLFLRMALNAVDGMLAREFGQQSALGGYLNEITDVAADAALYLPSAFCLYRPFRRRANRPVYLAGGHDGILRCAGAGAWQRAALRRPVRQERPRVLHRRAGGVVCGSRQFSYRFLRPDVAGLCGTGLHLLSAHHQRLKGYLKTQS